MNATLLVALSFAGAVDVPPELQPWRSWVLHGSERETCPARPDGQKVCEAPGKLELAVDNRGGTFTQTWRVFAPGVVPLPGDAKRWPLDVTVDNKAAVVVGAVPAVAIADAGEHVVRGRFTWDQPPESIAIPLATATVRLVVNGKDVAFVDRGDGDRVWLQRQSAPEEREEDRLDVTVFRKIVDGVPLIVETQALLEVSGKGREVALPGALLAGFAPLALSSSLPARIDGELLKIQVRPGRHTVTLTARRDVDDRVLVAPKPSLAGEGEEVWVFEADHGARVVNVVGPPSIVAEQTRLPDAWRALPAYRVLPGDKVELQQQRRGDENPAPSQLTIHRSVWLDFDGDGFTVHDEIGGRFTGDRLSMSKAEGGKGTILGRVSTSDGPGDAFITKNGDDVGVEVRSPQLAVAADSRIEGTGHRLPAVSWAHDFQSVSHVLHLPPGFRLLHAGGVSVVQTTWIRSWTLFELFLVVIITVAMTRLWGIVVGSLSMVTMALTFQEEGAVRFLWVAVVLFAALHRVLPPSWETRPVAAVLRWLRIGTAVIVALYAIVFAVQQVRVGMYPVLDQADRKVGEDDSYGVAQYGGIVDQTIVDGRRQAESQRLTMQSSPQQVQLQMKVPATGKADTSEEDRGGAFDELKEAKQEIAGISLSGSRSGYHSYGADDGSYEGKLARKKARILSIDPNSVVQTGPGLPHWAFTTVTMRFAGPVKANQDISLWLLSPRANFALAFVRVLLVAFLVVVAFGFPGGRWPTVLSRMFRGKGALFGGAAATGICALLTSSTPAHAADAPDPAVLEELKRRLLAPPSCAPQCASIARMALEASDAQLRVRAEVHALADVAVPLPGADKQWTASNVLVDGRAHAGVFRDGNALYVIVPAGRHDVVLEGALPRRDTVQLALPEVPHRAEFSSSSWTLDGVHEDGVPDANLQLSRVARGATDTSSGAVDEGKEGQAVLPPFLRVERSLILGLSFEVETRVVRLSPPGSAVVLEVPLLPGESVTTDGVRAEGGKVQLSLGPNDVEVHWSGALPSTDKLTLEAKKGPFVELWSLETSPVWHVEESGIPPVHDDTPRSGGARAWRPWPGEQLTLNITRPAGVAGRTITVEKTSMQVSPGLASTDITLTMVLRASRGGEHVVTLPSGAELLSATIDGRSQPLRPDNAGKVRVPIVPGTQTVVLVARTGDGIALRYRTPAVDAGSDSVNAELLLNVPQDRWILFAWGPRAGPAVLFWSFFVILVLTGIGLSRVPFSPLKLHAWILLGLGLTQVPLVVAAVVAGWLLALGWRKKLVDIPAGLFNLRQIALATWTVIALCALVASIHQGLLGAPDMQIEGNGSSQSQLRWFTDHASSTLPTAWILDAPMAAYRVAMLAWALWLAFSLLRWLRYGWNAFGEGGMWKAIPRPPPRPRQGPIVKSSTEAPPGAPTSAAVPSTTDEKK